MKVGKYLVSRFKFNYLIRYGIEHYVIFAYVCLDQLRHFSFAAPLPGISSILAIFGVAAIHLAPVGLLAFLLKYKTAIQSTDLDYAPFKEKWSSFLGEFRKWSVYQVAFLIRRLVLAYSLTMLTTNALAQTSLNALAGVSVRSTSDSSLSSSDLTLRRTV